MNSTNLLGRTIYLNNINHQTYKIIEDISYLPEYGFRHQLEDADRTKPNIVVTIAGNVIVLYYNKNGLQFFYDQRFITINFIYSNAFADLIVKQEINTRYDGTTARPLSYIEMFLYIAMSLRCKELNTHNIVPPSNTIFDWLLFNQNAQYLLPPRYLYTATTQTAINIKNFYSTIQENSKKDYVVVPVIVGPKARQHAVVQVFHFINKDHRQCKIYVFDPACNKNTEHINRLYNTVLQGNSQTCSYWSSNFAILASECESFIDLRNKIENGTLITTLQKIVSMLLDAEICYSEVNETNLQHYIIPNFSKSVRSIREIVAAQQQIGNQNQAQQNNNINNVWENNGTKLSSQNNNILLHIQNAKQSSENVEELLEKIPQSVQIQQERQIIKQQDTKKTQIKETQAQNIQKEGKGGEEGKQQIYAIKSHVNKYITQNNEKIVSSKDPLSL